MPEQFTATRNPDGSITFDGPYNPEKFYNFIVVGDDAAKSMDPIIEPQWEGDTSATGWPFTWAMEGWHDPPQQPTEWTVTEANDNPNRSNRRADYEAVHHTGTFAAPPDAGGQLPYPDHLEV